MEKYRISEIYVEPSAIERELTRRVLSSLKDVPVFHTRSDEHPSLSMDESKTDLTKKRLYIKDYKGTPLKHCPGTRGYLCCNYLIVNMAVGCPLNCSYCILQHYINTPCLTLYANVDYFLESIHSELKAASGATLRIGTGELTDSLALDQITGLSKVLVPFFAEKHNALLELKTKTANVSNLLDLDHRGRTVVAWSLNPQSIIDSDESCAATLQERLEAASLCQEAGYPLAFHFDPIVHYQSWEQDYKQVVEALFSFIKPESISWISMGGLRFSPLMKPIIREGFPESRLHLGELVPCSDGKLRYFKPIRVAMYRSILSNIRAHAPHVPVYMCMETHNMWQKVFGHTPLRDPRLIPIFHR